MGPMACVPGTRRRNANATADRGGRERVRRRGVISALLFALTPGSLLADVDAEPGQRAVGPPGAAQSQTSRASGGSGQGGIEEIRVVGRYRQAYKADSAQGAKMPLDLLELPQSIQVLSREFLDDLGAVEISDVYGQVAGVSNDPYSSNISRGFRQEEIRYNGLVGDPYLSFNQPLLFNVDRIEFLKGPSAVLYGGAEPGGFINYVTKKPQPESAHTLTATVGSFDTRRFSAESTGQLAGNERVLYRVGALWDDSDGFRDNVSKENVLLTPSVRFLLGSDTRITLEGEYIDQEWDGWRLRGVPVDRDGDFRTDIDFSANEPGDEQNLESTVLQATVDHEFTGNLRGDLSARYIDSEGRQAYHEARFLAGDGRTLSREFRDITEEEEQVAVTGNLFYETGVGGQEQTWLAGAEYYSIETRRSQQRIRSAQGVPPIDILEPVYGLSDPSTFPLVPADQFGFSSGELDRLGVYFQGNLDFGPVSLMLGGRWDDFEDESRADETSPQPDFSTDGDEFSLRSGVVYTPVENVAVYASYTESFTPVNPSSQGRPGGPFDPTEGDQVELGVKADWLDGRFRTTLAAYRIDKESILVTNPDPNAPLGALIQVGEVSSEGIEFELVGDVSSNLTVSANYAYNDVQEEQNPLGAAAGPSGLDQLFRNKPEHQAGAWVRYALDNEWLRQRTGGDLIFGLGGEYVDERQNFDGGRVREYVKLDGNVVYQRDRLELQLNVENLLDEEYVTAPNFFLLDFPGRPRSATLQVRWNL